ncbi:hypothetical protein [Malikia sp.]|uniref:hypothetical protein n=1 Tax=Malikia sp. TaxID=2070706 RepID=UPI002624DEBC|nr:hypothetical protein [Malikia sp.]MDD2728834.1 hypothetical protein [Malikia sp.]
MSLVAQFDKLIASDWKLPRTGNFWQIQEPDSGHSLFEIGGGQSLAFSLDKKGADCFPFFSSSAQTGMRQVTDAIVVAEVVGQPYVIAVEMKTTPNDKSKALRQIESGRCLFEWMERLLRFHGHVGSPASFCGVVSLKPRKQERKGTTRRGAELPMPERSPFGDYPVFVLQNHPRASVQDLIKKLAEAA